MNDKTPLQALVSSRKSIVALGTIVMAGAVIVTAMITKAEKDYVLALVASLTVLAFKMIGAIAQEDAAKSDASAAVAVARLSNRPPPPDQIVNVTIPPPPAIPRRPPEGGSGL